MPNIKSAKKRVSVIARRREENKYVKSTMATMIKNFRNMVATDVEKAESMLKDITSYIDSAQSKGVIHANTASRKISRLNLMLNKARTSEVSEKVEEVKKVAEEKKEEKPVEEAKAEKKTTAKKATTKKAAEKKETVKKTTTKKTAAKKESK